MKKPTPKIKVFIDTSVLIAGLASVTGAAATVLDLCESGVIQMVTSHQVLAAVLESKADFLVTWNGKHFLTQKTRRRAKVKILTPVEFLRAFEDLYLED